MRVSTGAAVPATVLDDMLALGGSAAEVCGLCVRHVGSGRVDSRGMRAVLWCFDQSFY